MELLQKLAVVAVLVGVPIIYFKRKPPSAAAVVAGDAGSQAPFYQSYNSWPYPQSWITSTMPRLAAGLQHTEQPLNDTLLTESVL